jgi:hypothetical protein
LSPMLFAPAIDPLQKLIEQATARKLLSRLGSKVASTTWKTHFGNGHRLPLVTGKAPITGQVLQMSQER